MSFTAQEIRFGEYPATGSYDMDKVTLSSLMTSVNGMLAEGKWAGPLPISIARPLEQSIPVAMAYPHVIQVSPTLFWVFLIENGTAAVTRRLSLYTYDTTTRAFNWIGLVTLTFGNAAQTARAMRMVRYLYATGSVSVTGNAATGTNTLWDTSGLATGGRIGFGTTDPNQVTQWYQISNIVSNTLLNFSGSATFPASTDYVIDELRSVVATTAATANSGGLYIGKGLNYDLFSVIPPIIPLAGNVDDVRANYFFSDAQSPALQVSTTAGGLGLMDMQSWQSHSVYLLTTPIAATARVYEFNMRANLSTGLANGRTWAALNVGTGICPVVGTVSQTNNSRIITVGHGPASGSESLYFATTTRICRAPVNAMVSGSTTFVSDAMVEIPPGGVVTFPLTSAMTSVESIGSIDRLLVTTSGVGGNRSYVTRYNTVSTPFDHIVFNDSKQLDQSTSAGTEPTLAINALPFSVWSEGGITFACRISTTAITNQLYTVPFGADLNYVGITNEGIITPKINTVGCTSFSRVYSTASRSVGNDPFDIPTETFRIQVRTAGIDDNTGGWQTVGRDGDLSFLGAADAIQFRLLFVLLGTTCIPTRVHALSVTYDADPNILAELEWNLNDSNLTDGTVGFTQNALFSVAVPAMTINYYRSDTSALVLAQASAGTLNGSFQWFNVNTWQTGLGPNVINTRRRFVPSAGLPANINVYAQIVRT
jgi:hypothetical protein